MRKILLLLFLFAVACEILVSCKKEVLTGTDPVEIGEKAAPDGFDYNTTKKIDLNVRLLSADQKPISGVLVSVYNPAVVAQGSELTKVLSDKNGYVRTTLSVPAALDTLIIDPAYIGLIRNAKAYVSGTSLSAIIGGESGFSGNVVGSYSVKTTSSAKSSFSVSANGSQFLTDLYDFDASGRPVESAIYPKDAIDFTALMAQVNVVLPEKKNMVDPKYLNTQAPANLNITKLADVWITFMHEGADYKNVLGYYTYPTGHAPAKPEDIEKVHIILKNASLAGSGGSMKVGDKVKIGRFEPGTTIGFVLIQDAYHSSNNSIKTNNTKFFTNEELNPEPDNSKKRHNVLLHNTSQNIFMVGFEDIDRRANADGSTASDNDFNDLVFYAQSNPVEAISPKDIPYLDDKVEDTDKDGVPDIVDEYDDDPTRAYNRFYPSESVWGTTAFEDQWPDEGDYDMNDLVISYRYKFAISAENKVVDMEGEFKPIAAGAVYQDGFGVQLPLAPGQIASVTGINHTSNYIHLASNGVEAAQSKAVLVPFDNYRAVFGSSASYINTYNDRSKVNGETVKVEVAFTSVLPDDFTAAAPFNPFMISNLTRGREIHLVNHVPTDLADLNLLKTTSDDSNPAAGRYYITAENRPFALDFFGPFTYPVEKKAIYSAYNHFAEWAASGGKLFSDWYYDKSGYRNSSNLYTK